MVDLDEGEAALIARVRQAGAAMIRCSRCGRKRPDTTRATAPAAGARPTSESGRRFSRRTPGVFCRAHGVVVADVPWARPKTRFTYDFEQTAAWLTRHVNKTRVCELLRIPFRTLTAIVERVVGDAAGRVDRLSGLRRIGIDERSFRRGQRYITVVVDHGTGRKSGPGNAAARRPSRSSSPTSGRNGPVYRAYLLKEQLRSVFAPGGQKGKRILEAWIAWALRSRIPEFVKLTRTIRNYWDSIHVTLDHVVTNARVEATNTNTHRRMLVRRAYGPRTPEVVIAMATFTRGGLKIELPGRAS